MSEFPGQTGLRNPLKVAQGLGSSRDAVHHWWLQRLTAVALIPLTIWFAFFMAALIGADYATVTAAIGAPVNAFLLILLTICMYWHGMLGLDVIIGDYVHTRWREVTLQITLRFGAFLCALATILAVLSIWFTGAAH